MKSACLLFLAALAVCGFTGNHGQEEPGVLGRAESLLLRSVLRRLEENQEDRAYGFQPERLERRQHPGKRDDEEEDYDEPADVQRRQHPGRRDDDDVVILQRRQHPGKRQHPGRRDAEESPGDAAEPDRGQSPEGHLWDLPAPCDTRGPAGCGATSLLLRLLDDASGPRVEEKRQHPGK
uniref:Pro-thyrotropin-releasing hormone n=1 Tax=Denticeps clupeoides TaxID=299321 RepID=A0AAY4D850_9TELE